MMAAIEDAGFRNYNGFRRGAHVIYYGEYYRTWRPSSGGSTRPT